MSSNADPRELQDIFTRCAERMMAGEHVEQILADYPQHSARLRGMLTVSSVLARSLSIDSGEAAAAKARVRAQVRAALERPVPARRPRWLAAAALVMVVGMVWALLLAENSLPGDPLYGLKRLSEAVRGGDFSERRLDEIRTLQSSDRDAEVVFRGVVMAVEASSFTAADLRVEIGAGVSVPPVGAVVEVTAQLSSGTLTATGITLLPQPETESDAPGLPPSDTPPPTSTVSPTQTPQPTSQPPPTSTVSPTQTPQPTSQPPPTSTVSPTQTPQPTQGACVPSIPADWEDYRVEAGDTLSEVAVISGSTVAELMRVNCLATTRLIAGQVIYVPFEPDDDADVTIDPTEDGTEDDDPGDDDPGGDDPGDDDPGGDDPGDDDPGDDDPGDDDPEEPEDEDGE